MMNKKQCCKCHKELLEVYYVSNLRFDVGYYCERCILLRKLAGANIWAVHYDFGKVKVN